MEIINKGLIKNPLNWFIVVLMVVVAGLGFHFLIRIFQSSSGAPNLANPASTNTGTD